MTDLTQDEVISKVSSIFDVKDIVINTNDMRLKIEDRFQKQIRGPSQTTRS